MCGDFRNWKNIKKPQTCSWTATWNAYCRWSQLKGDRETKTAPDSKHRSYSSIYIYWNCGKIMEKLSVVHINDLYLQALRSNIGKRSLLFHLTVCHHMTQPEPPQWAQAFPAFCSTSQGRVKKKSQGLRDGTRQENRETPNDAVIFAARCNNNHVNIKKTRLLLTCGSVCLTVIKVHLHACDVRHVTDGPDSAQTSSADHLIHKQIISSGHINIQTCI